MALTPDGKIKEAINRFMASYQFRHNIQVQWIPRVGYFEVTAKYTGEQPINTENLAKYKMGHPEEITDPVLRKSLLRSQTYLLLLPLAVLCIAFGIATAATGMGGYAALLFIVGFGAAGGFFYYRNKFRSNGGVLSQAEDNREQAFHAFLKKAEAAVDARVAAINNVAKKPAEVHVYHHYQPPGHQPIMSATAPPGDQDESTLTTPLLSQTSSEAVE